MHPSDKYSLVGNFSMKLSKHEIYTVYILKNKE